MSMGRAPRERAGDTFQATLHKIIRDPQGAEDLVREAERIGRELANSLATSQIRAVFGEVRTIEGDWQLDPARAKRRLVLLKPKMAYRAKKESGRGVEALVSVLSPAIDLVGSDHDNFRRFVEFFEAILAYHRAYGGK